MFNSLFVMKRIQTRVAALFAVAMLATGLQAQTKETVVVERSYPHAFITLQGGGQTTFTNYDNLQLITPATSLGVGVHFTPAVAARVHFNGIWNKGGIQTDTKDLKYKYNYGTGNLDLMLNMVNLFNKGKYHPLSAYLIGGVGLNYAWNTDDSQEVKSVLSAKDVRSRMSHNFRVGTMIDYDVADNWSINLEVAANSLSDRYNCKYSGTDDWQLTAQIGVSYKFGKRTKKVIPVEEVWETRLDTIWYDDVVYTPITKDGKATWNVFYEIRESDFEADAQLAAIGAFLKDHRDCKVSIKSYADVQTGNPKINMEYSKQRSEKAVKALTDAGVPASSITANYYGDTVQPFAENDKNRVTIIEATGLKDLKKEDKVKKFKTKEVRYRVQ